MKKNMGTVDRIFRVIVALIFFALYFTHTVGGTAGVVLVILGVVFLLTAAMGFCPLYLPFGIRTCPKGGN